MSKRVCSLGTLMAAFLFFLTPCVFAQEGGSKLKLEDTMRFGAYRTSRSRVAWSENGKHILVGGKAQDALTGESTKDTSNKTKKADKAPSPEAKAGEKLHAVSPDGKRVSFVRDHNMYVRGIDGSGEMPVSTSGTRQLLFGELDWVYQEEVYGRGDFNAMWWSPTSKQVAYLKIDESKVKDFVVIDHIPNTLAEERYNYPKVGDPNPVASIGVYDVKSKSTKWLDLSSFAGTEHLVVYVGWNPAGDKVVFQVQNRIQNRLELLLGDPKTGKVKTLIREESKTGWVNRISQPIWLKDSSFLWWSELTGFKHLYHYSANGKLVRQITKGPWVNQEIIKIDEASKTIWFYGNRDNPCGREAYSIGFDGKNMTALTPGRGSHTIQLNHDKTMLIDSYSSSEMPQRIVLRDDKGKELREVFKAEFSTKYGYSPRTYMQIPTRDGFMMDATLIKPHGFDPKKSYPIMLFTYSGPDAPSVRDSWRVSAWHQYVAQEGALVLQVNNRSSSGRGQKYIDACYLQFGKSELEDLEDAVRFVGKNNWADQSRVGISGWSYGGFMAAYALTHSKLFTVGIAGAGVYDWALYDTIYTERYMSTPSLNSEGYGVTSCLTAAKDLHGYLILFHGTMDDNVHFQNTVKFAGELQKAGKDFDMMIYPKMRHGPGRIQRSHIRRKEWKALKQHLIGG
ncbi:MAG: dipeptidyl-peptidase-4 [Planctomycetota bacterium]|jgi:dipeptidyl-peptidase-4